MVNSLLAKLQTKTLGEANSPGETDQKMLISNTKAIFEGLGGQDPPFAAN